MIKLKLKNALSYSGVVSATVKDPFVEIKDESVAEAAVKTGYFEVTERNQVPDDSESASGDEDKHTKSSIKKLSADEQRALIEELEGDPEETNNEEERIALILELQGE